MDTLKIRGVDDTLDGDYAFDMIGLLALTGPHPEALTNRELHRIKVLCGLRAGEIYEAVESGDSDVLLAIAAVVLTRNGKTFNDDLLWDAPAVGAIDIDIAEREVDDGPPVSGPANENGGSPARPEPLSATNGSSGVDSEADLASPPSAQEAIGVPV